MLVKNSCECLKSELDLFLVPPTNMSIEDGHFEQVKPKLNDRSSIEFNCVGTDDYIDLSRTYIDLVAKIYKIENNIKKDIVTADDVGTVNNFLHSLFSQVEVKLNNTPVENSNDNYPYKAYITDLLNYNEDTKESYLQSSLFIKDTPGVMNDRIAKSESNNIVGGGNKGFNSRRAIVNGGAVHLTGNLHCDLFNSDRYLINKVNIEVTLKRAKTEFCLMYDDKNKYEIEIENPILMIRRVKISPSVANAHNLVLQKNHVNYPIKKTLIRPFTISTNGKTVYQELCNGVLPNRIILGMVSNAAFLGDAKENPLNFQHFGLTKLELKCSGIRSPYKEALEFDFDNNKFMNGYRTLFDGIDKPDKGNYISRTDYNKGYTLFAFDFTPDLCSSGHFNLKRTGSISVDLTFKSSLTQAIELLAYFEFDDVLYIDKNRQVVIDHE